MVLTASIISAAQSGHHFPGKPSSPPFHGRHNVRNPHKVSVSKVQHIKPPASLHQQNSVQKARRTALYAASLMSAAPLAGFVANSTSGSWSAVMVPLSMRACGGWRLSGSWGTVSWLAGLEKECSCRFDVWGLSLTGLHRAKSASRAKHTVPGAPCSGAAWKLYR